MRRFFVPSAMGSQSGFGRLLIPLSILIAASFSSQSAAQLSLPTPRPAQMSRQAAEVALDADLQEALQMLEKKQYALMALDFVPMAQWNSQFARRTSGRVSGQPYPTADPRMVDELTVHLTSAQTGKRAFNRTSSIVQIDYVIKPVKKVPPKRPDYFPSPDAKPQGDVTGLGDDLPTVLRKSVDLLNAGQTEKFVRAMFPLPELAQLTNKDDMQRLLFRTVSRPEMLKAMVSDLTEAQNATAARSGNTAKIRLPALVRGDPERLLKFELVNGDWRFADSRKATRATHLKLMSASIAGYTVPGSKGQMILVRDNETWRLFSLPKIVPFEE